MPGGTLTLIVASDPSRVESDLRSGRLNCPCCKGELRPWGWARPRVLRTEHGHESLTPRRARCRACSKTSVLLQDRSLERRLDEAAVIGAALTAKNEGAGYRKIAAKLGRPAETVRGWLRRFSRHAEGLGAHFRKWALALDPQLDQLPPQKSVFAGALEAIGVATRAAIVMLGRRPPWSWASAMTAGGLLSNTNRPFPQPG